MLPVSIGAASRNEPQGAEGVDQGVEPGGEGGGQPVLGSDAGALDHQLDGHPEKVEISKVHDLAIEIAAPRGGDAAAQEQAGNEEEIRHAERFGPGNETVQPGRFAKGLLDAQRRMHHDHENDADALAIVDPVEAR